tara:strand:- start:89 stop:235 length:147 start_codon:yes stop_codon:yes gene_type:complete
MNTYKIISKTNPAKKQPPGDRVSNPQVAVKKGPVLGRYWPILGWGEPD